MSTIPTPDKPKFCLGCRKYYTISGFDSHLKQTKKPRCIAFRDSLLASGNGLAARSSSIPPVTPPPHSPSSRGADSERSLEDDRPDADVAEEVVQFDGDCCGSYSPADFDDYDNYDGGDIALQELLEEQDDEEADAENLEAEAGWEPPLPDDPVDIPNPRDAVPAPLDEQDADDEDRRGAPNRATQSRVNTHLHTKTFVVPFPGNCAGASVGGHRERSAYENYQAHIDAVNTNPYAPFVSRIDWEVARWAKMRGPGSTAVSELLQIEELVSLLGLSYKNCRELNTIVDEKLTSGRPRFIRREVILGGEVFEFFYRDILQCIRALYGDPEFSGLLVFAPEKHYADTEHTTRVYFDVHTGKWWWETQKELEQRLPGATIIPIIISSDKTQLTAFGSKTAYPVYMTIGNLPKDVRRKPSRRGQILLAYLPSSRLEHITNKAARRRSLANLFHACMAHVLAPLKTAGIDGIDVISGDGITRRGHPIFAMYIGDYPEQLLVACCKNGTCPKCTITRNEIGTGAHLNHPLRDLEEIFEALDQLGNGAAAFSRACRDAGIKPVVNPFWKDLPFVDVFRSITPDILHQLYQGVIKHLISWLKSSYSAGELDARCRRLPPNHQIRLFMKGITTLQKVTGKEHADMCRILLGLIIGLPLDGGYSPLRLVRAVRSLLDFLYLAQYPAHTSDTLTLLADALHRFHANKDVFITLGVRQHFKIPKLHSLNHYIDSIKIFGTTDNYDTQYTERLHIDFAKDAYRATNHKDEFPQMTTWLERREKISRHEAYVQWRLQRRQVAAPEAENPNTHAHAESLHSLSSSSCAVSSSIQWTAIKIAKWPSVKALSFDDAAKRYGATYLRDALARFVVQYCDPSLSAAEVEHAALARPLPLRKVQAFHKLKFSLVDAQELGVMETLQDAAHARPERTDRQGRAVPGRFDTVLINDGTGGRSGVQGYHIAQLRLVFKLSTAASQVLFPDVLAPGHLAYIERFTPFAAAPDTTHGLYKVARHRGAGGERLASVVEMFYGLILSMDGTQIL
ncbi:hypothetical protein BN946_scf184943.g32 [Trametes cinnabarina]|uniref:Uncharacterized protein n=1 Tax=Pycnoporus cinnabarinus TaxID=5643 RepID=A0A060SBV6_PYCCI|nr:hypothetical protein BN946_scf184943.g32 [Trametes cinnabarina]